MGAGGEGGIRTPDRLAPMPHFECGAFNHSATSPGRAKSGPEPPWSAPCSRRGRPARQGAESQIHRIVDRSAGPDLARPRHPSGPRRGPHRDVSGARQDWLESPSCAGFLIERDLCSNAVPRLLAPAPSLGWQSQSGAARNLTLDFRSLRGQNFYLRFFCSVAVTACRSRASVGQTKPTRLRDGARKREPIEKKRVGPPYAIKIIGGPVSAHCNAGQEVGASSVSVRRQRDRNNYILLRNKSPVLT